MDGRIPEIHLLAVSDMHRTVHEKGPGLADEHFQRHRDAKHHETLQAEYEGMRAVLESARQLHKPAETDRAS